jgi:hypothetical protein
MHEELWQGIDFKLAEADFFLDRMGKVLLPPRLNDPSWHPAYGPSVAHWQPDFYFYFDAFVGAARSVSDVVQKCFGWDKLSKDQWPQPLDADEIYRRDKFQAEFTPLYTAFHRQPLSRVRVGTYHWRGMPSVQTKAKVFCGQEYTGKPGQIVPSMAPRQFPPGTDPAFLALFGQPQPVEPSWPDFTLEIPQEDGSVESSPLFPACRAYLQSAQELVKKAKELCTRLHGASKLTPPPAVSRESRPKNAKGTS